MIKTILIAALILAVVSTTAYQLWPAAHTTRNVEGVNGYVDMHVHAACIGTEDNGCLISEEMRNGYKFGFYLKAFDVTFEELEREGDGIVLRKLSEKVRTSETVSKAIVLALDGVIDEAGNLDRERTQVYVPNEYLGPALSA